jgi:GxxExxY protein
LSTKDTKRTKKRQNPVGRIRGSVVADLIYPDESYLIMGACFEVYANQGPGFLEAVYQESLEIEFRQRGIPFSAQAELATQYKGQPLKQTYKADFVCYEKILIELKALSDLTGAHHAQVPKLPQGHRIPTRTPD